MTAVRLVALCSICLVLSCTATTETDSYSNQPPSLGMMTINATASIPANHIGQVSAFGWGLYKWYSSNLNSTWGAVGCAGVNGQCLPQSSDPTIVILFNCDQDDYYRGYCQSHDPAALTVGYRVPAGSSFTYWCGHISGFQFSGNSTYTINIGTITQVPQGTSCVDGVPHP
jgi:hypothetical protein